MPEDTPDADRMTPLGLLIRNKMDHEGWKMADVTRPAVDGGAARTTISHYLTPGQWLKTMPRPDTRAELAKSLRLDVATITHAAWRSLEANRDLYEDAPASDLTMLLHQGPYGDDWVVRNELGEVVAVLEVKRTTADVGDPQGLVLDTKTNPNELPFATFVTRRTGPVDLSDMPTAELLSEMNRLAAEIARRASDANEDSQR